MIKKLLLFGKSSQGFLLIILFFAFLFRFYSINDWISWGMDQEYEALIVKNIAAGKHFPLIGVNISDTGLYLGPAFIYFAVIPFIAFGGNPLGWVITASLTGVLVCYLIFRFSTEMFSKRAGIFAILLYASSFFIAFYERQFWNPMPIPLFSLLIGFFVYRILNSRKNNLIWLSIICGLAVQTHLSILILFPLIGYALFIKRNNFSGKEVLRSILIFIIFQLPILIFELRHKFLNTQAFIKLFTGNEFTVSSSSLLYRVQLLLSSIGKFIWSGPNPDLFLMSDQCQGYRYFAYPKIIVGIIILAIIVITLMKKIIIDKHDNNGKTSIVSAHGLIIGIYILLGGFLIFYHRRVFEYYLLFFFPWLSITLGWVTSVYWKEKIKKIILTGIIISFIGLNLYSLFTAKYSYSYKEKLKMIDFAKNYLHGKQYSLEAIGECPKYGGYRYLFDHYIGSPVNSYMDIHFAWLYPESIKKEINDLTVLLFLPDPREDNGKILEYNKEIEKKIGGKKVVALEKFGLGSVYIISN